MAKQKKKETNIYLMGFKDIIFITAGTFSAAFGVKGFLLTSQFIDG
jgi:hypothetical protein